jgi:hypothetical protein
MGGILYISKNFGVGLKESVADEEGPQPPFLNACKAIVWGL